MKGSGKGNAKGAQAGSSGTPSPGKKKKPTTPSAAPSPGKSPLRASGEKADFAKRPRQSPFRASSDFVPGEHQKGSPLPFVFSPSTSFHASSPKTATSPSPSFATGGNRSAGRGTPHSAGASPASSPYAPHASSPFARRGGSAGGRGRGGLLAGASKNAEGGGRGAGASPYGQGAGRKALNSSGGGRHFTRRDKTLGHWSDAINYDRVKRVINVYLNDFQLKDRDLERFIEWFDGADGGRRTLTWLLEKHYKGWDEEISDANPVEETAERTQPESESNSTTVNAGSSQVTKPPGMNWHLQENQITDEGVKALVAFATKIQSKVELRRFYLYKNIIGDDGAAAIASFIKGSPTFVYEIHLSHNRLTIKGATDICVATKYSRAAFLRPLWLRLEWNYVSFAKLKKLLQDQGISYCRVKDRVHCAPSKCAKKPSPLLHLYVAELQYSESVGTSSRLQMAKERVKQAKEALDKVKLKDSEDKPSTAETKPAASAAKIDNPPEEVKVEAPKQTAEAERKSEKETQPSKAAETAARLSSEGESENEALLKDVPTYIFLDTCAVLRMSEVIKGAKDVETEMRRYKRANGDGHDFDIEDEENAAEEVMKIVKGKVASINQQKVNNNKKKIEDMPKNTKQKSGAVGSKQRGSITSVDEFPVFTFDNLVERAKRGKFGENLARPGDQVTLVITDTVMRELDHLKSSKPGLMRNILSLQSDDGYLAKGVHLKFIEMLGAHQGEHLVALQDSSIVQSYGRKVMKATSSLDNDRKIIDVALFWNSEIGVTGNVILLTADEGVREAAKRHNLPSDLWKNLNKRLFNALKNDPTVPWTATLIKSCMPGCMVKRDGKTMHLTPSVKPVQSVFQELDNALVLTYLLMDKVRSLQADNQRLRQQRGEGDEVEESTNECDSEEIDRLLQETRERRRTWLEILGQMAGPMSPMRMKGAEQILRRVMKSSQGEAGLGNLMKTSEFLEVDQEEEEDDQEDESLPLPQEETFEDAKATDEAEVTVDADDEDDEGDEDADDLVVDEEEISNDTEAEDTATGTEYDAAEPVPSYSAEDSTCGHAAEEEDIPEQSA